MSQYGLMTISRDTGSSINAAKRDPIPSRGPVASKAAMVSSERLTGVVAGLALASQGVRSQHPVSLARQALLIAIDKARDIVPRLFD